MNFEVESVVREKKTRGVQGRMAGLWGGGAYYLPWGPWLTGSGFRRLPTKHPWRKSCAPHNNTPAPGHPHTGNLRSLPPFQGVQTLLLPAMCTPSQLKKLWGVGTLTWKHVRIPTWIRGNQDFASSPSDSLQEWIWAGCQTGSVNTRAESLPVFLFWSHM